ncbi:uncharacterized protein LOC108605077 [Drosophila busckii]|uniref:uncharacterized protein LOC108605077 n=1 Tax=Drosophila busckii TaxID=30019 RepID=UPI00083F43C8|nr:uncharacterized protein LOC108605077 [Drosophila busckii]
MSTDISVTADESLEAKSKAEIAPLVKLVQDMGYPEGEARLALRRADNNLQLAIQILVEGNADSNNDDNDEPLSEAALQRRCRRRFKQLRSNLMGNPALNDYHIADLMKQPKTLQLLNDVIKEHSVTFLESLMESSSDSDNE